MTLAFIRPNGKINIKRITGIDFDAVPTLTPHLSEVPARIEFRRGSVIQGEGMITATDVEIRVYKNIDVQTNDYVEILPDKNQRYRVETVDDVNTTGGRIVAKDLRLVRSVQNDKS